jgi:hypothetical protein
MANDEWYTPPEILVKAWQTLGSIGFDPCHSLDSPLAALDLNKTFTKEQDSLSEWWNPQWGPLWLNPPYSNPAPFVARALAYNEAGLVLVNSATETKWGQRLLKKANLVLFVSPRIRFWRPRLDTDSDEISTGYRTPSGVELVQPKSPRYSNMIVLINAGILQEAEFTTAFAGMGVFR